jgi:hypothetical protein
MDSPADPYAELRAVAETAAGKGWATLGAETATILALLAERERLARASKNDTLLAIIAALEDELTAHEAALRKSEERAAAMVSDDAKLRASLAVRAYLDTPEDGPPDPNDCDEIVAIVIDALARATLTKEATDD